MLVFIQHLIAYTLLSHLNMDGTLAPASPARGEQPSTPASPATAPQRPATPRQSHSCKRKLDTQTLETKYKVILEVEKGNKKKGQIAKDFNVKPNTLSTWLNQKDKIKSNYEASNFSPASKRMRTAQYSDVEKALDVWFKDVRSSPSPVPINGPILQDQAQDFSKKFGHTNFSASNGWLHRFKQRHGYAWRSICGEAGAVNKEDVTQWTTGPLATILSDYQPEDIFNCDETGLFWKLQPNKSFVLKGETCSGGKRSKERVTVLPCANMSGTEKLPLLVIGKFARPRCFKGMDMNRLPTEYKHQKRAWMDSALFTSWVNKLDQKMAIRGRKIALIMDNCPAHPTVPGLKATKVIFLPPNTTSVTQPMDQGIIQNLKVHYRHLYVKRGLLPAVEKKEPVIWTLLDCMSALKDAWTKVKPSTVANCFKHCGFVKDQATIISEDDLAFDPEDDLPLAQLRANIQASNMPADDEALHLFLEVDDDISTSAPLTADGIVQDIQSSLAKDPVDTDSEEEEEETTTPPTYAKAMESLATLRHFLVAMPKQLTRHEDHWDTLSKLEQDLESSHHTFMKQKSIKDFFNH